MEVGSSCESPVTWCLATQCYTQEDSNIRPLLFVILELYAFRKVSLSVSLTFNFAT